MYTYIESRSLAAVAEPSTSRLHSYMRGAQRMVSKEVVLFDFGTTRFKVGCFVGVRLTFTYVKLLRLDVMVRPTGLAAFMGGALQPPAATINSLRYLIDFHRSFSVSLT